VHGKKKPVKNLVDGRTVTVMISDIEQQNGGLAINLTEKAIGKLQVRSVKTGKSGKESRIMVADDFGIGVHGKKQQGVVSLKASSSNESSNQTSGDIKAQLVAIESMWKQNLLLNSDYQEAKVLLLQAQQAAEAAEAPPAPPPADDPGISRPRPPVAGGRRTTRAPPASGPKTKVVVKSNSKGQDDDEDEEESEEEEDEDEEEEENEAELVLTEKQIQEALLEMGQCSQGFDWIERDQIQACDACGASGMDGWNCSAGGHWMCRGCVLTHAKKNKGKK
jgi:hypothetical protein